MRRNLILLGFAVMGIGGCGVNAPESRGEAVKGAVPGRWVATAEARAGIDTQWVRRIGGSGAESAVSEALRSNPDMRVAGERVRRAVSVAKIAGAARNPQVMAGLDAQRQKQVFVGFPFGDGGVPSSIFSNYGSSLSVSWEPDVWGFQRAGQSALIAEAQAEGNVYRAARASLAAQVVRAWLALAEANEQIALAEKTLALLKSTEEIVRERYQNALADDGGSASQVRLAQSELATQVAALAQRGGEREQAIRQLELLMGRYPAGIMEGAGRLPSVPPMPPAGLPSELLLRRPDLLEAERRFAASGKRLEQGRLAFFPSFQITGRNGTTTDQMRSLFDSDFGVWGLTGALTQPIWAGGRLREEVRRLGSEDRQKLAELQGAVLGAFGEVEQALVAERFLAAREEAIKVAVTTAIEAADAAVDEYVGGTGDALTLIAAQGNRVKLEAQQVSLRRLRLDQRVTLHLALGGDFRVEKK